MTRAITSLLLALSFAALAAAPPPSDRVWLAPGPGTIDFIRLFERPEEWAHTRQLVSVFKFYQQHTHAGGGPVVGPNSYEALARAGVFRTLGQWGKKIAIESGAVKEFFCTPDASGMALAVADSVKAVRAVESGGGTVAQLAMDEPFVAGREPVCGGPALEPTADRVATYIRGVQAVFPAVKIGWIEAYPFSSAPAIEAQMGLLTARGVSPAFLHLDVAQETQRVSSQLRRMTISVMSSNCAAVEMCAVTASWMSEATRSAEVEAWTSLTMSSSLASV